MFETVDNIYNYVGQCMFNVLPDDGWKEAVYYVSIVEVGGSITKRQSFFDEEGQRHNFDVDLNERTQCTEAFYSLNRLMQKDEKDIPWNKARLKVTSEGEFEIKFKLDEDFTWYNNLDPDSQEFDDLDIKVINQIESWEGLAKDYQAYWR